MIGWLANLPEVHVLVALFLVVVPGHVLATPAAN